MAYTLTPVQKNKVQRLRDAGVTGARRVFTSGLNSGLTGAQTVRASLPRVPTLQGGQGLQPPQSSPGVPNVAAMGMGNNPGQSPNQQGPGGALPQVPGSNVARNQFGLPLDPLYEAGRRRLEDQLQATLARIAALRPQYESQGQLSLARMATNQGRDLDALNESLVGRGIYRSGITARDQGVLGNLYDRQRQDLAFNQAQTFGGLANEEAQARLGYNQGLNELMLQLAARQAQLGPYSAAPRY